MLRFKIDENLPVEAALLLRKAGHDADTVSDESLAGSADAKIADISLKEERVIVTLDLDFADIRAYPPERYPGIIVMRLKRQDKLTVLKTLARILAMFEHEDPRGSLWIIDEKQIRIRM